MRSRSITSRTSPMSDHSNRSPSTETPTNHSSASPATDRATVNAEWFIVDKPTIV